MDLGSSELDRLLTQTRTMLESLGTARPADGAEEARGEGQALDGRVRVVARAGRVDELRLDPRVMRMGSEELAEHVTAAVNAALNDLASRSPAEQTAPVDPQVLAGQIAEIQEQSVRQLAALTQAIGTAVRRVQEAS
jgi:DNA-binding protein YbaB